MALRSARICFGFLLVAHLLGVANGPQARANDSPRANSHHKNPFKLALERSQSARIKAKQCEDADSDVAVDHYYEATVRAHQALESSQMGSWEIDRSANLYNDNLRDCLRAAARFGRIDPEHQLTVNGPHGAMNVPVTHRGFVWSTRDFQRLIDPRWARHNPAQRVSHLRVGLGASQVVSRENPQTTDADRFLPARSYFPATAVLRPDPGLWGDDGVPTQGGDKLELIDPLRVSKVEVARRVWTLASDPDSSVSLGEEALDSRQFSLMGFINPELEFRAAGVSFVEPYQPGKIVIVIIHGLLDNPFTFTDLINGIRTKPEFHEKFQIAAVIYPTGNSFLRSAALIRAKLLESEKVFDPTHSDPGFQNMVLIGYSMGGLISKLQISSSGDQVWQLASNRPLDAIVTSQENREFIRKLFYFEPLPFVSRVIFIAAPHDGSGLATNIVGRTAKRLVRRPSDTTAIVHQIDRDNPGAIKPFVRKLPTSIDLLATDNPLLKTMMQLPKNPRVHYHSIVGIGYLGEHLARGDGVVPLKSAHIDGADSELWVPALHTNIFRHPHTILEVERIIDLHALEVRSGATASVAPANAN